MLKKVTEEEKKLLQRMDPDTRRLLLLSNGLTKKQIFNRLMRLKRVKAKSRGEYFFPSPTIMKHFMLWLSAKPEISSKGILHKHISPNYIFFSYIRSNTFCMMVRVAMWLVELLKDGDTVYLNKTFGHVRLVKYIDGERTLYKVKTEGQPMFLNDKFISMIISKHFGHHYINCNFEIGRG